MFACVYACIPCLCQAALVSRADIDIVTDMGAKILSKRMSLIDDEVESWQRWACQQWMASALFNASAFNDARVPVRALATKLILHEPQEDFSESLRKEAQWLSLVSTPAKTLWDRAQVDEAKSLIDNPGLRTSIACLFFSMRLSRTVPNFPMLCSMPCC